ncbi:hypothetical protein UNDYM_5918 (plasmid) [Undibacterium sp. YM2]|uniref:multiubiquitin domain-containing protein n=1 Tax=Undibacterium sp. YM2 TaxID=2058625 RepID=UPI001331F04F|nr:multiubiquitin domain-containing protein [Undibacterium sp. YM2]BBB70171.1 hypothetical protein UNDYM_5918 [Undibacterium sp. YM2]
MPTQKRITINIDGQQHQVIPGATRGNLLHALAAITELDQLYLEVPREPDVPVNPSDLMFLRGGEIFSIGVNDPKFPENPIRRNAITFNLNDQDVKLLHEQHAHTKATGAQIKALVGSSHLDLWADLEGIPDALVEDHDIIILQPNEVFFTVERDQNEEQDRFFEVTAVFNGEQRSIRLPMLMRVNEAIRRILPDDIRVFTEYYIMRDGNQGGIVLAGDRTLRDAGIMDGHVITVAKSDPELHLFFVNSKPRSFKGERISYEDLVRLAEPNATFEFLYTVSYTTLSGQTGTLAPNQTEGVEDGEDFRVRKTNRS